jgi:ABC-type polysaccharide/polyol phosphate transport system ATPase subunit
VEVAAPIEVSDVTLRYRLDRNRVGTVKEAAVRFVKRDHSYESILALDGVTFTVSPGEIFGVIGPNGAGKSTLMKIIARVLPPSSGRVIVRGSVAPMIELGAGFNPEFTARENVIIYGALLGRDPKFMRERVDVIVEWAGVADFVDIPVRTFSSGMKGRLAFSVATDIEPDILLVDEVLAVGDQAFRKKSEARMNELISGGASVVVVSHALGLVRRICERVMWIDSGRVKMIGPAQEVVDAYEASG